MIGWAELILIVIATGFMWFLIFKFILKYRMKKLLTNIPAKMEAQDKRIFNDGKEINIEELFGEAAKLMGDIQTQKPEVKKE